MDNRYVDSPKRKSLIGDGTEFENDARLNRDIQLIRFLVCDRMV